MPIEPGRPRTTFENLPNKIFDDIIFYATTSTLIGPPTDLLPLLCVSRSIHTKVSPNLNGTLYVRLFQFKFYTAPFDDSDVHNYSLLTHDAGMELKRRFVAMKRIWRVAAIGSVSQCCSREQCRDDLWMLYLMFLLNDRTQLDWFSPLSNYLALFDQNHPDRAELPLELNLG
jgi:hypothetical protein